MICLLYTSFVTAVYGGGAEGVKCYIDKLAGELTDTMQMCGAPVSYTHLRCV